MIFYRHSTHYFAILATLVAAACGPAPEEEGQNVALPKSGGFGTITIDTAVSGGSASSEDFTYIAFNHETGEHRNGIDTGDTQVLAEGFWALSVDVRPPGYLTTTWSGTGCDDQGNGVVYVNLPSSTGFDCTATHTLASGYTEGYGEITVHVGIEMNEEGCSATAASFDPHVGSTAVTSDVTTFFPMGTYAVTQNDLEDYFELPECSSVTISEGNPFGFCEINNYCMPF